MSTPTSTWSNKALSLGSNFYHLQPAEALETPSLLAWNEALAKHMGLPQHWSDEEKAAFFSGKASIPGSEPASFVYAGHQFGVFVPQLGDGRALWLGEVTAPNGQTWELQLKGSGRTPFSRMGDGRAVLRSSIREWLCSEAMSGLGIPTTQALALVGSPQPVYRETIETAAVLTRVAPSFFRFGSVEYFARTGQPETVHALLAFMMTHYASEHLNEKEPVANWFKALCQQTARLMVQWQAVGFCHGVMNTDNFSLLGLTLDYGPFGFMEAFNPNHVCNHSDHSGRYAFAQQPAVGYWNLQQLGSALLLSETLSQEAIEASL
jgi:serine/tyrosine/threonine adenylyltransferase